MKTLALLARKGGAGKTTVAVHLAVAAVQTGRRVVLVDSDPQRSAGDWWRTRAADTPELVQCEASKVGDVLTAARLDHVDLVVVDTRPSVETDTAMVAKLADLVLIPTRPSSPDLRAIGATVDVVRAVRRSAWIVLNAAPPGRGIAEASLTMETRTALRAYHPVQVCPMILGQRAAFSYALIDGQAVTEFDPDDRAATELRDLYSFTERHLWEGEQP